MPLPGVLSHSSSPRNHNGTGDTNDLEREQTAWYFYLAEISLRRLGARLGAEMEELHKAHNSSRCTFLEAAALVVPCQEAQVHELIASLRTGLSFSAPAEEDDTCRFVLRGLASALLERIYWPFLSAYLDGTTSGPDLAWLAPYVTLAQKGLDHHLLKLAVNKPGFRYRHHGTYAMVQSCSRSALVFIAASSQSRSTMPGAVQFLTMPAGWEHSVQDVISLLEFWGQETRVFHGIYSVLLRAFARAYIP